MSGPLVSIITPSFNSEAYIRETIESVQAQTYTNWEHIIVDDASSDRTPEIINELASKDDRIRIYFSTINQGAAYCRNLATEYSKGDYIAFLDSDDLWKPQKLAHQIKFMESSDCGVSYTNYIHIDENGVPVGKRILAKPRLTYKEQLFNNFVGNLTGVYSVKMHGKILAPNIRKRQDWAVWLEAIKREGKPARGIDEDLALYRVHDRSMSKNKWKLVSYNFSFYHKYLKFSIVKSWISMIRFLYTYLFIRPRYIQKY